MLHFSHVAINCCNASSENIQVLFQIKFLESTDSLIFNYFLALGHNTVILFYLWFVPYQLPKWFQDAYKNLWTVNISMSMKR